MQVTTAISSAVKSLMKPGHRNMGLYAFVARRLSVIVTANMQQQWTRRLQSSPCKCHNYSASCCHSMREAELEFFVILGLSLDMVAP